MSLHVQRFEGMRSRPRSSLLYRGLFILCMLGWMGLTDPAVASGGEKTGAKSTIVLREPDLTGEVPVERALASRRSVRSFGAAPLGLSSASQLLWAAQGITHPLGLRTAPSAGAPLPARALPWLRVVSQSFSPVYIATIRIAGCFSSCEREIGEHGLPGRLGARTGSARRPPSS